MPDDVLDPKVVDQMSKADPDDTRLSYFKNKDGSDSTVHVVGDNGFMIAF